MQTFIIVNGTKLTVTQQKNIKYARQLAVDNCDHEQQIVVKHITEVTPETLEVLNSLPEPKNKCKINQWNI